MLCHLSFLAQKTVVHFEDVVHHTSVALLVAAKFQHVAMAATGSGHTSWDSDGHYVDSTRYRSHKCWWMLMVKTVKTGRCVYTYTILYPCWCLYSTPLHIVYAQYKRGWWYYLFKIVQPYSGWWSPMTVLFFRRDETSQLEASQDQRWELLWVPTNAIQIQHGYGSKPCTPVEHPNFR